jgi:hypothetical protein
MQETVNPQPVDTKHRICMDENRFGVCIFIISLLALIISALPFIRPLLEKSELISRESFHMIFGRPIGLFLWGWLLGLGLAVFSLFMAHRLRDRLAKSFIWVVSSLAIIAALLWLMCVLFLLMWSLQGGFH